MAPPGDLDALSPTELKALVLELLSKVAALERTVAAQRAVQGLRGFPRSGPGAAGPLHPLSPGALADTGRAPDRSAAAGWGRWSLRAGAAPLCAGPVSSGASHRAALSGAAADHRPGHLHTAGHAPADRGPAALPR